MDRTIRISGGLYACLLTIFIQVAPLLFLPAALVEAARQEGYLAVLIDGAGMILVGLIIAWSGIQFGRKSPVQAVRAVMGKALGLLASLLYGGFAIWIFSLVIRDVLEFSVAILLPDTPGLLIAGLLVAICLHVVWNGLEPLARIAFQAIVVALLAFLLLPAMLVREFSLLTIEPFLFNGIQGVLQGSLRALPWFGEMVVFFSLVPRLSHPREAYRWTTISIAVASINVALFTLLVTLVYGPVLPSRLLFPGYSLLQMISLAQFLQRMEVVLVVVWISSMFIKASVLLYVSAEAITDGLGLKSHRWPGIALSVVGLGLAQIWPGTLELVAWGSSEIHAYVHLGAEGTILILISVAALILRVRQKGSVSPNA